MGTCKRRGHRNYNFVIQCGCTPLPQPFLPPLPRWFSLALHLSWLDDQAWAIPERDWLPCTWVSTMNSVEKYRDSVPMSFSMFIAAILLGRMCVENSELWGIEDEVAEHFELVITPFKDYSLVCIFYLGSPKSFLSQFLLVFMALWKPRCCHLSFWDQLPPRLFQFLSHHFNVSFSLSL